MLEEYIIKTIISFISLCSALYLTKEGWDKINNSNNSLIKAIFNRLIICLIPVFRWIFIIFILIIGIALNNDDFANKIKKER